MKGMKVTNLLAFGKYGSCNVNEANIYELYFFYTGMKTISSSLKHLSLLQNIVQEPDKPLTYSAS